jgi:CsbD-like
VKPLVSRMIKRFISFTGIRLLLCGHAARHRTRNSIKLHRVTHPRLGTLVSIIRKLEAGQRQVKEKWSKLADDDLTAINGRRDQLEGKIQERYGYAKD